MVNFQFFDTCSSLPELLEKKRLIDLHTNVATAVLEHIKVNLTFIPHDIIFTHIILLTVELYLTISNTDLDISFYCSNI